jgi:hypothetical protein
MVAPVSPALTALTGRRLELRGDPNALRRAVIDALAQQGGEWEVRVQLCTDLERMPVEDASVPWPEDDSPYRAVARIRVPAQPAWSEQRAVQADDGLAFSPWHGITAHQPLGSVNRVRRPTYAAICTFRAEHNRHPIQEPRSAVDLSGAPASTMGTTPGREGFRNASRTAPRHAVPGGLGLGQRMASGAVGGLAGGLLVSAILLIKQALARQPSDLAQLQRKLLPAYAPSWRGPNSREEGAARGGHLGLSVASGALYGALKPAAADPVTAGLVFGAGFLALASAGTGPALHLTPPPWRDTRANNLQHAVVHALFGITTALVADRVARRFSAPARRRSS